MSKRFKTLDAFRGLCALSVVVFHMNLVGSVTELDFFRGSSIFVEFFFVLSGFVLVHRYAYGYKSSINFKTFMQARFFRLYPLHFFMFLVFVALEFGKLFAYQFWGFVFNDEPFTNASAISEMLPNLLLIQAWTPFTNPSSFNAPSWSISIEFYLYILLFLTVAIFKKNRIFCWACVSFIALLFIYFKSEILMPNVLRGISCFFGGAFTYLIYQKLSHFKPSYLAGSIIEGAMLICVVLVVQSHEEYRTTAAPVVFFLTVLFFAFESGCFSRLLQISPLQYAGKISYSIYMTHAAILFMVTSSAMVLQRATGVEMARMTETTRYINFGSESINNLVVIFVLMIVIYISSLSYEHIETIGQKFKKKLE